MPDDTRMKVEDEWFARNEEELLLQARRARERRLHELQQQQKAGEEKRLKELHWLKCPKCGHDMAPIAISGVEADRCGTCEGIFFDRGELETVLLKKADERRGIFRKLMGV